MKSQNTCYTYFSIVGDFNPDQITESLGLQPDLTWKIGDLRENGTKYDFARWNFGRCDKYDVCIENQMRQTISLLLERIDLLNQIREQNDVHFILEIVPTIYAGNIIPCLAPPLDVVDFCHATRTEIDIDMYVYNEDDE